jgi:HSP20 family protein
MARLLHCRRAEFAPDRRAPPDVRFLPPVPGSTRSATGSPCRTAKEEKKIMAIMRRNLPWPAGLQELEEMTNRLSRAFDDFPGATDRPQRSSWLPAVNVEETKDEMVLTAELPGMRQEDVEIELENNVLTISGNKQSEREEQEERRYHLWERRWGSFQRSFTLPRTVDAESIEATFQEGVLTIRMPKVPEAKGRRIEIRSETAGQVGRGESS